MVRLGAKGYVSRTNLLISVDKSFAAVENSLPGKTHRLLSDSFPRAPLQLRRGERKRDLGLAGAMPEISSSSSLRISAFICSIFLQFITGLSDDTSSSKNDSKVNTSNSHSGGTGTKVAIICLAVVAIVLFSFFLFKLWQKKKREEQYARLLKLFEEDDELEVELGLKD